MKHYFAYGSNMSRQRLEARTQEVVHHGAASLAGFSHSFTHRGGDGTGKGNIIVDQAGTVCGVLYSLTSEQAGILHGYEIGYEIVQIKVHLLSGDTQGEFLNSYTYVSKTYTQGLSPLDEYFAHYSQGMHENEFPEKYVRFISLQAAGSENFG